MNDELCDHATTEFINDVAGWCCSYCGAWVDPDASTGASERPTVDRILAQFPMDEHGTGHIADCGFDANDERCDCYTLRGRIAVVLAAHDAARGSAAEDRYERAIRTLEDLALQLVMESDDNPVGNPLAASIVTKCADIVRGVA